jgi:hypothetical protein
MVNSTSYISFEVKKIKIYWLTLCYNSEMTIENGYIQLKNKALKGIKWCFEIFL